MVVDGTCALPTFSIAGTPYEAGLQLGHFGAAVVRDYLTQTPAWQQVMTWRRHPRVAAMAVLVQSGFPGIWQELAGLADGLGQPVDDVFLWNCRGDLWAMAPDGCTTVMVPGLATQRLTHNEDGDPGLAGHCALVQFAITGSPAFTAFVYPGSIAGHTFARTQAGLAMTVNNLRARNVLVGVPRMVLTRALLDASDVDAAIAILRQHPRAGGFHLALGARGVGRLTSVEFSAADVSTVQVDAPSVHANHAIHPAMQAYDQLITPSSQRRQQRGQALLDAAAGEHAVDALSILRDTQVATYPIHRMDPLDPDGENTLATVDIVIGSDSIDWTIHVGRSCAPA